MEEVSRTMTSPTGRPDPVKVITSIRESFPGSVVVYTRGACFEFFKILRSIYPDAEPYYDHGEGHVFTKIDGKFYDINGRYFITDEDAHEELEHMGSAPRLIRNAHRWMPHSNFRVVRMMDDD